MPYTYIDLPYMKGKFDARVLSQLTNDDSAVDFNDPSTINDAVLQMAENDAAQTVDNFLRNIYSVPLAGAALTPEIKGIVASLTWCHLWERRGEESSQVTALRKRMYDRLEAIAKPGSLEQRDGKTLVAMPSRSSKGKERTMFDHCGYFDGLPFKGTRTMVGDSEASGM